MTEKIVLENAFVLHARPYRETSLLLDFFTEKYGRVSAIAKGARSARSPKKSILQPFRSIVVSMVGRNDLKTLTDVELRETSAHLTGDRLFSAMYINELLYHSLPKHDPHTTLFLQYQKVIRDLSYVTVSIEPLLRVFERQLLSDLGYAISLTEEVKTGAHIIAETFYLFKPGVGFIQNENTSSQLKKNPYIFLGAHLLAFAKSELFESDVLQSAKRLMRIALAELLGEKAINAKKLFSIKMEE